ncbi:reverse transcriptase [Hamiltosporidium tvaerminnensis]|uniref:Reverse transcriptase n=1 Tax=Hamiltosporidium tvaerminnensis TaxID=1176355 RepID=A0A4Q9LZ71_9MICR|nr:reverse transcriptase [Hamiltosporidium tvaerminnensis]
MQNNGLFTLPSPNTPLPSSVEVLHIPEGNRLVGLLTIYDSFYNEKSNSAEDGERRRIATCLTEPCTLTETTDSGRTRKNPNELVDSKILDLINRVVAAYIKQAAQVCYDEAKSKEMPRFAWKENIESKMSKLVLSKDLLEKARFNLNMKSETDLSEALKKITMHESRKKFGKENRMFELFRGRFYRGLSDRVESEHVVCRDEIDDYLIPFVSDNPPTTFPFLDDFVRGSDYRPITFMSNLYKLTTKCVTKVVQLEVERRGLLAENQLGAVRGGQGAKEQALLNIALNKEYGNNLKATWIDVKNAYGSIDHAYLTQCIENLNLPDRFLKFIKVIISKWKIDISVGPEKIMSKKIDRGILQGDSLSPLLFVLCMNPLSRKLNEKYTKVTVQTDAESHSTNHLLFIDDLKLLAKDSSTLSAMTGEAKEFLEVIELEINKEKSATNDKCCEDTAALLEGVSVYKYLGIIEDSRGIPTCNSFEIVQSKLISRVERLLLRLEPADFSKLDDAVRAVLVKNKIHLRPGCKERLYLPRTELGRGLHSVELRSKHMLLKLKIVWKKSKEISTRRAAIFKVENNNKIQLALIKGFLKVKYRLVEEVTKKSLEESQLAKLFNEIEKRKLHSKLYIARKNELVSVRNIRPQNEAVFCYIQDRNVFWGADGMCQHCGKSSKTIRVDTRIKTDITLIEVGITSQDSLQIVETEKLRKYNLLANELGLIYKCNVEIILYVMTWDCITVETISFDRRRELEPRLYAEESYERAELNGAKHLKGKNDTPLISEGGTTVKEPTININDESDLEEETKVVKMMERII